MNFVFFYRSLVSDWNHADAHFLRGIATELLELGHGVTIYEPEDGWSLRNLREQCGDGAIKAFHATYPRLRSEFYRSDALDLDEALDDADVVIVHDRNDLALVERIGRYRAATGGFRLLFHDTNHRALSAPEEHRPCELLHYDGVLAIGERLRRSYEEHDWAARAWTWHEAADTRIFRPLPGEMKSFDLVWEGSWGNGERATDLVEYLVEPVRTLGLRARVYGWRYPEEAVRTLQHAGIDYAGWIPNFCLPAVFAAARFTIHVPRRFGRESAPGVPTIRVFEALACGVPLVSAPWMDCEGLFEPGADFLVAADGKQMQRHLQKLHRDEDFAAALAAHGHRTIRSRHTCAHRVQELLGICERLGSAPRRARARGGVCAPPPRASEMMSWWTTA